MNVYRRCAVLCVREAHIPNL